MSDKQIFTATDFAGIYKEIAEVIGIEATITLHDNFQGQQITLPKKLFAKDFILRQVKEGGNKRWLSSMDIQKDAYAKY